MPSPQHLLLFSLLVLSCYLSVAALLSSPSISCTPLDMSSKKKSSSSGGGSGSGAEPRRSSSSHKKNHSGSSSDGVRQRHVDNVDPNAPTAASPQASPSASPLPQLASSPISPSSISPAGSTYSVRPPSALDTVLSVLLLSVPVALIIFGVKDQRTKVQLAFNALLSVGAYFAVARLIPVSVGSHLRILIIVPHTQPALLTWMFVPPFAADD